MKKICLTIFTVLFSVLVFQTNLLAATLSLDKIGALSTNGKKYSEWWYTGTNPTLSGTTSSGKTVKVTVNGVSSETKAGSSGNWSKGTTLGSGKHTVNITSDSQSYAFTLNIGTNLPTSMSTTQSTGAVPTTGSHQVYFILFMIYLAFVGFYLYKKNFVNESFEKKVLR